MAVVVRCPACRGAAQVDPVALGELVMCPRCNGPFVAVQEATPVTRPRAAPVTPTERPERHSRRRSPRSRNRAEPVAPPSPDKPAADPHDKPHEMSLPASVLIGLALLPFVIPLLWLVAPMLVGQPAALSLAAPTALAVTASALSLAVIYTVDWTPATRIKGVLMLVGLAYFAGLSLYFLKKDMVDRVKRAFDPTWHDFRPPDKSYKVRLPGKPHVQNHNLGNGWNMDGYRATLTTMAEVVNYSIAAGKDPQPGWGEDKWFEAAKQRVLAEGNVQLAEEGESRLDDPTGRQWVLTLQSGVTRIVRVYRVKERMYYLAVEGVGLRPDDDDAEKFLTSFAVLK